MADPVLSPDLRRLSANEMLFLLYAARVVEKHGTFARRVLQADFPFTSYLFADQDVEALVARLCSRGAIQRFKNEAYEVAVSADTLLKTDTSWAPHLNAIAASVLERIPLEAFAQLGQRRGDDPVLRHFASQYLFQRPGRWDGVVRLSAVYNGVAASTHPLGELAEAVFKLWDVQPWEIGDPSHLETSWADHGFAFLGAEIGGITPWHSVKAVAAFVNLARYREEGLSQMVRARQDRWLSRCPEAIHLLVPIGETGETGRQWLATFAGFINLEPQDLRAICLDGRPGHFFRALVRRRMDLRLISPYSYAGPVRSSDRFFGRHHEIALILTNRDANYAIYGSRKIGKTSLLRRLAEIIPGSDETGRKALFVDCEGMRGVSGVCRAIAEGMGLPKAGTPGALAELIRSRGEPWCLLLDEADAGAEPDDLERLLRALRSLCNTSLLRVIMSGYRLLYAQYKDSATAAHNLATPLRLGYLDHPATEELIRRPMEVLGVAYGSRAVERIADYTQGHPSLVQKMCSDLIIRISALKRAVIEAEDAEAVFEGRWDGSRENLEPDKAEQLNKWRPTEPFSVFAEDLFFGTLNNVEKLLVLTSPLATSFNEHIVILNMQRLCPFVAAHEIKSALDVLELALVLDRDGNSYRYAYKRLPRILGAAHDRPALIAALRREEMARRGIPLEWTQIPVT